MDFSIIDSLDSLQALKPAWQELWLRQARRHVFQHFDWVCSYIQSFCPPLQWKVLVTREQGMVVGLLPLASTRQPGQWRLLGSPNADYQHALVEAGAARGMLRHLAGLGMKVTQFEEMPEGSTLLQSLQSCDHSQLMIQRTSTCHYLELSAETVAGIQRKSGIKDNVRRLAKLGPVEVRIIESPAERVQALEILFDQHRSRWDPQGLPSQFHDPATCSFYRRLCEAPGLRSMLHFSILHAGERPVACHLGFVAGDSFIYYKPTYDPAVKGAGQVLMSRLMAEAQRMGLKEFDFTRGGEAYKGTLATGVRYNYEARMFFTTAGWLRHRAAEWLRHRVPRDATGLALTTKFARRIRTLMSGH